MYLNKNNSVCAIIAEYNPLHKGHEFHIKQTKAQTGCDYCIVLMSGDFVQRGAPAICNKYERTRMALLAGADLVLELPAIYSLSSAQGFAKGAVSILNRLNTIDLLSFGSECGDVSKIMGCAKALNEDEEKIDSIIKENIKSGMSFPSLRAEAIKRASSSSTILDGPNNILGIEYCRALDSSESKIAPFTIKRFDNGFNEELINEGMEFASARSIRNSILSHNNNYEAFMPNYALSIMSPKAVSIDDFSDILYYKLLGEKYIGYDTYLDVSLELSHKIIKNLPTYKNITSFIETLKSKNLTYVRISRALFHILLNIRYDDISYRPSCVRILGFKKNAKDLLSILKKNSEITLISKLADAPKNAILEKDIYCANIYEQIAHSGINEIKCSPIIL